MAHITREDLFAGELTCGDCGVPEGTLHERECDMERCPFCGRQLISCDCRYELLDLFDEDRYGGSTTYLPPDVYVRGLSEEQEAEWERMLNQKGRIPYIQYPNLCGRCGELYPDFFRVSDEEWQHYIQPDKQKDIICRRCYLYIKSTIDEAQG
jgi:hypothetical protein